ncbi:MAG: hypothetical protein ACOY30_15245 [Bacillota bacterium]
MKVYYKPALLLLILFFMLTAVTVPVFAEGKDYDLSQAVAKKSDENALKSEVGKIGGSIVNAVRALFITFFAVAVLFMGVQSAGGGLKDPRKLELVKGGGITATVSAVLVYKAEEIVAFVLKMLNVHIDEYIK